VCVNKRGTEELRILGVPKPIRKFILKFDMGEFPEYEISPNWALDWSMNRGLK